MFNCVWIRILMFLVGCVGWFWFVANFLGPAGDLPSVAVRVKSRGAATRGEKKDPWVVSAFGRKNGITTNWLC